MASTLLALLITSPVAALDVAPDQEDVSAPKAEYSPYAGDHLPNRVLFGNTHLHHTGRVPSYGI